MLFRLPFLILLVAIAACSSPEERAEQQAQREITRCTQAGYTPGTPQFEDCRLQIRSEEEERTAERIKDATDNPALQPGGLHSSLPGGISFPMR